MAHQIVQLRFFGIPRPYAALINGISFLEIELEAGECVVTRPILSMRRVALPKVKNITLEINYICFQHIMKWNCPPQVLLRIFTNRPRTVIHTRQPEAAGSGEAMAFIIICSWPSLVKLDVYPPKGLSFLCQESF
jgi:hypothetical protein